LYEQVEAQRMELEERDARIAEAAQIVKLARSAARQLAQKDAVIKDKDAEIARLSAKMMQFEQLAALMNAATQPSGAGAGASTKRTESGSSFANEQSSALAQQHQRPHYQQRFHQECSVKQLPMRQVIFELHFQEVCSTMEFLEARLCKLFHQLQTASCMDCTVLYHASTVY
jgi:hypothetical protein